MTGRESTVFDTSGIGGGAAANARPAAAWPWAPSFSAQRSPVVEPSRAWGEPAPDLEPEIEEPPPPETERPRRVAASPATRAAASPAATSGSRDARNQTDAPSTSARAAEHDAPRPVVSPRELESDSTGDALQAHVAASEQPEPPAVPPAPRVDVVTEQHVLLVQPHMPGEPAVRFVERTTEAPGAPARIVPAASMGAGPADPSTTRVESSASPAAAPDQPPRTTPGDPRTEMRLETRRLVEHARVGVPMGAVAPAEAPPRVPRVFTSREEPLRHMAQPLVSRSEPLPSAAPARAAAPSKPSIRIGSVHLVVQAPARAAGSPASAAPAAAPRAVAPAAPAPRFDPWASAFTGWD